MGLPRTLVLFAAAVLAGVVNSVAGGGSLISFPALVWAGLDPVLANATNTVAISPGALAAMIPFRRELRDMGAWVRLLGPPSLAGGAVGAWLLLATPERLFAELVPALVLFATVVFALQEVIARLAPAAAASDAATPGRQAQPLRAPALAIAVQLAIAIYGGYFGAGIGILMLAGLGLLGVSDFHRALGLRSFLGLCINGVAALYFVGAGTVDWFAAAVMIAGQVAGGYGGAAVVRRVPRPVVRHAVVAIGLAMAASLFFARR